MIIDDILKPLKYRQLESEYTKRINKHFAWGGGVRINVSETRAGKVVELLVKINDRQEKSTFPPDYFNRDSRKIIERALLSHVGILLSL